MAGLLAAACGTAETSALRPAGSDTRRRDAGDSGGGNDAGELGRDADPRDAAPARDTGAFDAGIPSNPACAAARPVAHGTRYPIEDTRNAAPSATPACAFGALQGNLLYYSATVQAGTRLVVTARAQHFGMRVRLFESCTATSCLAGDDGDGNLVWANDGPGSRDVVFAIGTPPGFGSAELELTVAILPAAPNLSCETALPVTSGSTLMGQDTRRGGSGGSECFPSSELTGLLYYTITVPAGEILDVSATATGSPLWRPEISVLAGCNSGACLASTATWAGTPTSPAVSWRNNARTDRPVIIAIGRHVYEPASTFDLTVSTSPTPQNASCSAPLALSPGAVLTGQDSALGASGPVPCFSRPQDVAGSLFYSITVPGRTSLQVSVIPDVSWSPRIAIFDRCTSGQCLASSAQPGGQPGQASYANSTPSPVPVLVSVGHDPLTGGGGFAIHASLHALTVNSDCAMAVPVTDGTGLRGQDTSLGETATFACTPGAPAQLRGVLWYSATVPAGETLAVQAAPTSGSFWPQIVIAPACGSTSCLASSLNAPPGGSGTAVRYTNTTGAPQPVVFAVAADGPLPGTFDLSVTIRPPPRNAACTTPTPLNPPSTLLTPEDGRGAIDDLSSRCLPQVTGGVLYYSATIPPGETLQATASPLGFGAASIRLLSDCAATSCLASAEGPPRSVVTLTHANTSTAAEHVIVAVGPGAGTAQDRFRFEARIARSPYRASTIPGSCDNLSGAPSLPGPDTDDSASDFALLPFVFPFFRRPQSAYSVSSNGNLQLSPVAAGRGEISFIPAQIPVPSPPNGFIAPLWDDLMPPAPGQVRTETLGAAPNRRFVVQWTGFGFIDDTNARLTFQAKLLETSGAIELHYCELTAGTQPGRETGSRAAIGVEDAAGTDGVQISYQRPGAVSTANAIRFDP